MRITFDPKKNTDNIRDRQLPFDYVAELESDTVYEDAMIAACAITHKPTVVTGNVRDFERFDAPLFNPFGN